MRNLHIAANWNDETIIGLAARLAPNENDHEICNVYGKQKDLQPSFQS
jgi:hypothetical protein